MSEDDTRIRVYRNLRQVEQHLAILDALQPKSDHSKRKDRNRHNVAKEFIPYLKALGVRKLLAAGTAGITIDLWKEAGFRWYGLTLPEERARLHDLGINADGGTIDSLPYMDGAFDAVYASHVLEHSAMPLVALMEFARVAPVLALVVPTWPHMVKARYHLNVVPNMLWHHWFRTTGWLIAKWWKPQSRWVLVRNKEQIKTVKGVDKDG